MEWLKKLLRPSKPETIFNEESASNDWIPIPRRMSDGSDSYDVIKQLDERIRFATGSAGFLRIMLPSPWSFYDLAKFSKEGLIFRDRAIVDDQSFVKLIYRQSGLDVFVFDTDIIYLDEKLDELIERWPIELFPSQ